MSLETLEKRRNDVEISAAQSSITVYYPDDIHPPRVMLPKERRKLGFGRNPEFKHKLNPEASQAKFLCQSRRFSHCFWENNLVFRAIYFSLTSWIWEQDLRDSQGDPGHLRKCGGNVAPKKRSSWFHEIPEFCIPCFCGMADLVSCRDWPLFCVPGEKFVFWELPDAACMMHTIYRTASTKDPWIRGGCVQEWFLDCLDRSLVSACGGICQVLQTSRKSSHS